jgi:hypothetical protein
MMDAFQLASSQDAHPFEGIATSRNPHFEQAIKVIVEWKRHGDFPQFIIPVRPDHFDRRVSLQRSCFTFHVPKPMSLNTSEIKRLDTVRVLGTAKAEIRKELSLLGIDEFAIFGDLDHLAERLKAAYTRP